MVDLSLNKVVGSIIGIAFVIILIWAATYVPLTRPGKVGECRHELSAIRTAMQGDGTMLAASQIQDEGLRSSLDDLLLKCCMEFSQKIGKELFRIRISDGKERVVDPWGTSYNIDRVNSLDPTVNKDFVRRISVGDIAVWSSGPNRINENGAGDDVFLVKIRSKPSRGSDD